MGGVMGGMTGGMMGGGTKTLRRNQSPGLLPVPGSPPRNSLYSKSPASNSPPASANASGAEWLWFKTSTTRIPSPTVSAPEPPAFRTNICVARLGPTDVPSTTSVSEIVAAPPSLRTVSSSSEPPLEMNVPPPPVPGVDPPCPPVIINTSPGAGLLCRSITPELVNVVAPMI
jgi:hypothetical protein